MPVNGRRRWKRVKASTVLLVLLLLPGAAALDGLPRLPAPEEPLPEGCHAEGSRFACSWERDARAGFADPAQHANGGAVPAYDFPIPTFRQTLATVTVTFTQYVAPNGTLQAPPFGMDNGWHVAFYDQGNGSRHLVSVSRHPSSNPPPPGERPASEVAQTTVHLLIPKQDAWAPVLELVPTYGDPARFGQDGQQDAMSLGSFRIRYVAEPVPGGAAPSRPAATREDPQLVDAAGDAESPQHDVLAAWFDDGHVGDGLFEAYLLVGNLTTLDFSHSPPPDPGSFGERALDWRLHFRVAGHKYVLLYRETQGGNADCELQDEDTTATTVIMSPDCGKNPDVGRGPETGLIAWGVPERSVGLPGTGVPFTDISATTDACPSGGTTSCPHLDEAQGERYPFALGGPAVWSRLNARLDPPILPWYKDPVSEDNLPNTLQVTGALLAALTFLGGLVAVTQRRRQTRRLLDRVEAVEQAAGIDSRAVLLALGRLEEEFTLMFRRHRISESQYQILSQRIASVATRFALRRELGLVTGAAPLPAEPTVRIPVRDGSADEIGSSRQREG
jgi:hypothetical protein